jgi:uncharacterized protein
LLAEDIVAMGVEAAFAWLTDTPMPPAGWAWPHKSRHGGRWRARVRARSREHWERLRKETPRAKRRPSEYVREHFWFTTQPIEEPDDPQYLADIIEWVGWDRLMFSTDYPHWDFDDPQHVFRFKVPDENKALVFRDNAMALYGLQ